MSRTQLFHRLQLNQNVTHYKVSLVYFLQFVMFIITCQLFFPFIGDISIKQF